MIYTIIYDRDGRADPNQAHHFLYGDSTRPLTKSTWFHEFDTRAHQGANHAAVTAARTPVDALALRLYDRVAARTRPVCVPVHAGKCGGCHLRLSGEADSAARKGDQLATCDQCGRIVWWEAV